MPEVAGEFTLRRNWILMQVICQMAHMTFMNTTTDPGHMDALNLNFVPVRKYLSWVELNSIMLPIN